MCAGQRSLVSPYPQYASNLLGTGRDIVGLLFTCDALGLRLERDGRLPGPVAAKLGSLIRCERLLGTEAPVDPVALAARITREYGIGFSSIAHLPGRPAGPWAEGRDAIHAALAPLKLPADAVVMIGARAHQRGWADAARLAKFMPAEQFFEAG